MKPFPPDFMHREASDPIWDELRADHDAKSRAWFKSLPQGDIVHYFHGFDCWVRCEIVDHPLCPPIVYDPTKPCLIAVALVGPAWATDHECTKDHWRESLTTGRAFQPSATHIYESPYWDPSRSKLGDPAMLEAWFSNQ